jgi:hypothetical protein
MARRDRSELQTGSGDRVSLARMTPGDAAVIFNQWFPEKADREEQVRGVFGRFGRNPDGAIWWEDGQRRRHQAPSAIDAVMRSDHSAAGFAHFYVLTRLVRGGSPDYGISRHRGFNPVDYVDYSLQDPQFVQWVAGAFGQGKVESPDSEAVMASIKAAQVVLMALDLYHVPELRQ